jgi:hypothetical protein
MPILYSSDENSIKIENLLKGCEKGSCIDIKIGHALLLKGINDKSYET